MASDKTGKARHFSPETAAGGTSVPRRSRLRRALARLVGVVLLSAVAVACVLSAQNQGLIALTSGAPTDAARPVAVQAEGSLAQACAGIGQRAKELLPALEGWVEGPDGVLYFDPDTHERSHGWVDLQDGRHYFDERTGYMQIGWLDLDGKRWWLDDGSHASRGTLMTDTWLQLDEATYHLSSEGPADTGWHEVDGKQYCFADNGAMQKGWATGEDGAKRWLKDDGTMASNEWIQMDDGIWQVFDVDGSWVTQDEIVPPDDDLHVVQMSARQQAVVNACDLTPWPGKALCARWVSDVFVNAGERAVGGDACDIANTWCTSSDLSDLRPGMVIAVPSHPRTDNGKIWGHVCIYVGGGLVRDSGTYGVRRVQLSTWFAWFGATNTPRWGWANGVSLA